MKGWGGGGGVKVYKVRRKMKNQFSKITPKYDFMFQFMMFLFGFGNGRYIVVLLVMSIYLL